MRIYLDINTALVGAYVLLKVSDLNPVATNFLSGKEYFITPVKLTIAILLNSFAVMEVIPYFRNLQFGKGKLVLGGLPSGFFGGLSGNQGALRSAFLIKSDLSKEAFIATGVVVACIVDFSRLGVYLTRFAKSGFQENLTLVIAATASAFAGAYAGRAMLRVVTLKAARIAVTTMLVILSVALAFGIV
jgi:uncharacterized membrane protein YfcA